MLIVNIKIITLNDGNKEDKDVNKIIDKSYFLARGIILKFVLIGWIR
jgi:hypothetical protein